MLVSVVRATFISLHAEDDTMRFVEAAATFGLLGLLLLPLNEIAFYREEILRFKFIFGLLFSIASASSLYLLPIQYGCMVPLGWIGCLTAYGVIKESEHWYVFTVGLVLSSLGMMLALLDITPALPAFECMLVVPLMWALPSMVTNCACNIIKAKLSLLWTDPLPLLLSPVCAVAASTLLGAESAALQTAIAYVPFWFIMQLEVETRRFMYAMAVLQGILLFTGTVAPWNAPILLGE